MFPDLKLQWESYIKTEYQNYNEERLDYVDIGEIIRYIVEQRKCNDTSRFTYFFDTAETILVNGDDYKKELMVVCHVKTGLALYQPTQKHCMDHRTY